MAKPKRKIEFVVAATYRAGLYFDDNLDGRLNKVVGHTEDGGGMGMGERDLSWTLKTRRGAFGAKKRIQKLAKKLHRKIKVTIHAWDDIMYYSEPLTNPKDNWVKFVVNRRVP